MSGIFHIINIEKGKSIRIYCAPDPHGHNWNELTRNWIAESPGLASDLYDAGLRLVLVMPGIQNDDGTEYWPQAMRATADTTEHKLRLIKDVKWGSSVPYCGIMFLYPPFSLDVLIHEAMHFFNPTAEEEEIRGNEEEFVAKYSSDLASFLENHPEMYVLRDLETLMEWLATPD
jgi:hypothetical protein